MRAEIKALHHRLSTTVYVTHDAGRAMTMPTACGDERRPRRALARRSTLRPPGNLSSRISSLAVHATCSTGFQEPPVEALGEMAVAQSSASERRSVKYGIRLGTPAHRERALPRSRGGRADGGRRSWS